MHWQVKLTSFLLFDDSPKMILIWNVWGSFAIWQVRTNKMSEEEPRRYDLWPYVLKLKTTHHTNGRPNFPPSWAKRGKLIEHVSLFIFYLFFYFFSAQNITDNSDMNLKLQDTSKHLKLRTSKSVACVHARTKFNFRFWQTPVFAKSSTQFSMRW